MGKFNVAILLVILVGIDLNSAIQFEEFVNVDGKFQLVASNSWASLEYSVELFIVDPIIRFIENLEFPAFILKIARNIIPGYGKYWIIFPGGDHKLRIVILKRADVKSSDLNVSDDVTFYSYTRKNPNTTQIIKPNNESLKNSFINFTEPFKVLIHGWRSSYNSNICQNVKDAYLKSEEVNVICVDWYPIAKNNLYPVDVVKTRFVGMYTASLLDSLVITGVSAENIHVIGHSLGAHVSGFSGKYFTKGKLGRITGLDPALPGYEGFPPHDRLDKNDASFVDVIHTCAGVLGYFQPLGQADFYPNRGIPPQPGCTGLKSIYEACSHERSVVYYTEAVGTPLGFMAQSCKLMIDFGTDWCSKNLTPMGPATPSSARGLFYLKTNNKYPFAKS